VYYVAREAQSKQAKPGEREVMSAHLPRHVELDLLVEQMYYSSAIAAASQAGDLVSRLVAREGQLSWLIFAEAYDLGDEIDPDEEDFRLFDEAADRFRHQFGVFLQSLVITHVLSAMSLEAYINRVASEHLSRRFLGAFERLSLEEKWIFLPRLLGAETFEPGSEPFQGFASLLRRRNRLVHAKATNIGRLLLPDRTIDDLMSDGMRDARHSIVTVDAMCGRLSDLLSLPLPDWLKDVQAEPFRIRCEV